MDPFRGDLDEAFEVFDPKSDTSRKRTLDSSAPPPPPPPSSSSSSSSSSSFSSSTVVKRAKTSTPTPTSTPTTSTPTTTSTTKATTTTTALRAAVPTPAPPTPTPASTSKPATAKSSTSNTADDDGGDDDATAATTTTMAAVDVDTAAATQLAAELKTCQHQVALPKAVVYSDEQVHSMENPEPVDAARMAKQYPFTLDPFQRVSVSCLEKSESVLVSAHTSAGKTVVAEYAIAMALRDRQRVVYTSPIKALSNQKYRELNEQFGDVGLMTGDVTISPNSSCLVMTTEILRSMLYRGSEIMREVAWVVFDEIHYMRDKERGVVWEETIILLPDKVNFVFLSATIPNAFEFAQWIAHIHRQPCHVVYTEYRPTPLQHYIFPAGGDGLHLVVDEKGKFRENSFRKAISALAIADDVADRKAGGGGGGGGRGGGGGGAAKQSRGADCYKIVKMIMERNYEPVIVFSFSKRDCETMALQMSKLDFNNDDEKELVRQVFANAMDSLSDDDRSLPQIDALLPLLERGVAIHHSGLLPILKETIEILFQEGLVKALFATETFSIGLNMPAKTVVFTSVRKYDGNEFRWISGGEYIQMSGRAGRRGLDDRGIVIMMVDQKMEPAVAKSMVKGHTDPLISSFHLTYNMLLNLIRVEGHSPEELILKSFHQFQIDAKVPESKKRLIEVERERDDIVITSESVVREYFYTRKQLAKLRRELRTIVHQPRYLLPFLKPGRVVYVGEHDLDAAATPSSSGTATDDDDSAPLTTMVRSSTTGAHGAPTATSSGGDRADVTSGNWGWGVVVGFQRVSGSYSLSDKDTGLPKSTGSASESGGGGGDAAGDVPADAYVVDVLLSCVSERVNTQPTLRPARAGERNAEMIVVPVSMTMLARVTAVRVFLPNDLRLLDVRQSVRRSLDETQRRFADGDGLPLLDPHADMHVDTPDFRATVDKIQALEATLATRDEFHSEAVCVTGYRAFARRFDLDVEARRLRREAATQNTMVLKDELKAMKRVLRRLNYLNADNVVELKGRTACEINAGDELLMTEMIYHGLFNELTPAQCAALVSTFAFQEKSQTNPKLSAELAKPLADMQERARRIALVSAECKLAVNAEEYVASFKPSLMDSVYAWARGASFIDVMKLTDTFEGSFVRAVRRLEEMLRQLSVAAKTIGNTALEAKVSEAVTLVHRGIIFSASLYL